ncbi:MAG: thermonuclease family protein [Dictyoglomus turgidum]
MKKLKFLYVLLLCIVFSASVYAFEIPCKVTRIVDGDTFHCIPISFISQAKVHKDGTVSVRLRGVDAPEKTQPFGKDAQESLKELIGGETVLLDIKDIDRYGRVVAYVFVRGVNVNLEQVKRGMAWAYTEYLDRPYASEFYEAEKQARKEKKGLWKQSNPIPPWEWRKRR